MSPLGNEDARAQVVTNGGLSQRWRADAAKAITIDEVVTYRICADELAAAKLRIEEAVRALTAYEFIEDNGDIKLHVDREAVLKIIRGIL